MKINRKSHTRLKSPLPKATIAVYDDGSVFTVIHEGRTTTASLEIDGIQGTGVAKCMPGDRYSKQIGQGIAEARALREIVNGWESLWLSRSVTEKDYEVKHRN